jgi:hypothetical protein
VTEREREHLHVEHETRDGHAVVRRRVIHQVGLIRELHLACVERDARDGFDRALAHR